MREVDNQTNPLSVSFSIYPYPINTELPWGQYNQVPDGIGYSYPTCEFSEILNDFVWLLQHVSHDCTLAIRDHAPPPPPRSTGWHLGEMVWSRRLSGTMGESVDFMKALIAAFKDTTIQDVFKSMFNTVMDDLAKDFENKMNLRHKKFVDDMRSEMDALRSHLKN